MELRYFAMLPPDLRLAVQAVEDLTGSPIRVGGLSQLPAEQVDRPDLPITIIDFDEGLTSAAIYFPADAVPHLLAHEVMHIAGRLVHEIPALGAVVDNDTFSRHRAHELCNDIEHCWIVRDELAMFPEARDYWKGQFDAELEWVRSAPTGQFDPFTRWGSRRYRAVRLWMSATTSLPHWPGLGELHAMLVKLDLEDAADQASAFGDRARADKPLAAKSLLELFQFDIARYRMIIFKAREGFTRFGYFVPEGQVARA